MVRTDGPTDAATRAPTAIHSGDATSAIRVKVAGRYGGRRLYGHWVALLGPSNRKTRTRA